MINREQTQADLLDQFRQEWAETPPAGLDSGVAATAVMLREHLSPPGPSARFVQNLGQRLDAETSHSSNHRPVGVLPLLPDQTVPPSTLVNTPQTNSHDGPRRSWMYEAGRIAAAGLAIALVGTILMLVFRDADDAVAPGIGETEPHPGQILVSWDPNGGEDYKLFIVDTDNGEWRKLTPGSWEADGIAERYPSWSPDGRRVAFVREEGGQSDIFVMNAGNFDLVNITNSPYNEYAPIWSPDGEQIAFNREGGEPVATNIYLMNADGSDVRQLTSYSSGAVYPDWSPDGSQIAFARVHGSTTQSSLNVWIMNVDGSEAQPITELDILVGRPRWSPDGEHIAFVAGSQIWVVAPDGSSLRSVTEETGATSHPAWSSDGQRLVYISGNFVDGSDGVGVANIDGTILERWSNDTDIQDSPAWSPDEQQIAFFSGNDRNRGTESAFWDFAWELRVAGVDGAGKRSLLTGGSLDFTWPPAWRPPVTGEEPPPGPDATPTPTTETGTDRLYVVTSNGVTVTDPATNDEIYSINAGFSPDAALSPDGSRLYVAGTGGIDDLVALDAASGDELWRTPVEDRIRWMVGLGPSTLAVSPDGNQIYVYSSNVSEVAGKVCAIAFKSKRPKPR